MPVRYDPALISGIADEIRTRWLGRRVEGVRLYRDRREAWLLLAEQPPGTDPRDGTGDSAGAIGLLLHPTQGFIVASPGPPPIGDEPGRRIDFRRLFLSGVRCPPDERLLVLDLAGGLRDVRTDLPPVYRLYVELHTNQWNAVLAAGPGDRIEAVLWPRSAGGRSLRVGGTYRRPEGARPWAAVPPGLFEWSTLLEPVSPPDRRAVLLRSAAFTSSLNVDWILGGAAGLESSGEDLARAFDRYLALRSAPLTEAWLVPRGNLLQPYPVAIGPDSRRCAGLLAGMAIAAEEAGARASSGDGVAPAAGEPVATPETEKLERKLRRRLRDLEKRKAALQRQVEGTPADRLRELGNLLLARKKEVPRGGRSVTLTGFDGADVEIALDPKLDAVGNADVLYDRARRRERAARGLPDRLRRTSEKIEKLQSGLETLRGSGPSKALWDLVGGQPADSGPTRKSGTASDDSPLPYRRYRSSGGLEIRVGRSSRGNDALTFRHSAPDDIWLHARQAAGAHVILRWEKRDQNPPQADLTEAAVLAALHSEARHSSLVAVDWTRRKHVRKPRKAAPGTVVPERVATLFVEPDPSAAERLSQDP